MLINKTVKESRTYFDYDYDKVKSIPTLAKWITTILGNEQFAVEDIYLYDKSSGKGTLFAELEATIEEKELKKKLKECPKPFAIVHLKYKTVPLAIGCDSKNKYLVRLAIPNKYIRLAPVVEKMIFERG